MGMSFSLLIFSFLCSGKYQSVAFRQRELSVKTLGFPISVKFLRYCVLSDGSQQRAMSSCQTQKIKIIYFTLLQLGIKLTTDTHLYSHTTTATIDHFKTNKKDIHSVLYQPLSERVLIKNIIPHRLQKFKHLSNFLSHLKRRRSYTLI